MNQLEYSYYIPPDATINNDGTITDMSTVYQFDDRAIFFEKSFSGWGMPNIEYITQQGPYQHGETVLDYRLQKRIVQLAHRRLGDCRDDYWNNRSDLINFLRVNRQVANTFERGRLRKILPDGKVRDLYVLITSGPRFNARNNSEWDEYTIEESLRFIAHDPVIFDPALKTATWVLASFENLIFYETTNWENRLVFEGSDLDSGGIWFGSASLGETLNVTYNGTWLSYPTIIITGPLDVPRIFNNTTNEKIELNYEVSAGETVTINLDYGQKTVINNFGVNLIGTMTTDSDMATFHIAPHPEALNGINELAAFGDDAVAGSTQVQITYYEKYIGI